MLKNIITLVLITLGGALLAGDVTLLEASSGQEVELGELAQQLQKYDVVFFGEWHGNAAIHSAQAELLELLYQNDERILLSFEMFERDTQNALDAYLSGKSTEEEFLANSRPWPNYATDYRPLVEFAREHGLPGIAANVPRSLAGSAARGGAGFLDELSEEEKDLVARKISAPEGKYRERFMATMRQNAMHGDSADAELYQNLFLAQCVKDDTMAESILRYRELHPQHRIIHFNGDFHSREFLGTVERISSRDPELKLAVISPLPEGEELPEQAETIATWFILVPLDEVKR